MQHNDAMKRYITEKLIAWKNSKFRKPLLLKGVRQVGKTYTLKTFGEESFPNTHYFNFEEDKTLALVFDANLDPTHIIAQLSLHTGVPIDVHHDLVIFDEIQACPNALTSLKYFNEKLPELALCSAGSLLGVYLGPVSFPVGKVDMLDMYPLSFEEFLMATGDERYADLLRSVSLNSQITELAHSTLWDKLKLYFITGGLPEVIQTYNEYQDELVTALNAVRKKQKELIKAYYADFAKHSGKVNSMHIDRVWTSVPKKLSSDHNGSAPKYTFKDVIPNASRYSQLSGPIDWLERAGLIIKTPIAYSAQLPISAYTKENTFKLYMFDVGILGALGDLHPNTILDYSYGTYKGYFAENFVAQAFLAGGAEILYCWREGKAELEFIRDIEGKIIPIEVKSGHVTQTKSLNVFAKKYEPLYRTVIGAKNLHIDHQHKYHVYPLYLAYRFPLKESVLAKAGEH